MVLTSHEPLDLLYLSLEHLFGDEEKTPSIPFPRSTRRGAAELSHILHRLCEPPVNSFEFQPCDHTPQAEHLTLSLRSRTCGRVQDAPNLFKRLTFRFNQSEPNGSRILDAVLAMFSACAFETPKSCAMFSFLKNGGAHQFLRCPAPASLRARWGRPERVGRESPTSRSIRPRVIKGRPKNFVLMNKPRAAQGSFGCKMIYENINALQAAPFGRGCPLISQSLG